VDRRDFIRIASWAGLTCVLPSALDPLRSSAQSVSGSAYTGTYWIFMHAGGGWDPTHLCDPKGRATANEDNPMGRFLKSDIRTAGNISYAPLGDDQTALDAFFQTHYQRLLNYIVPDFVHVLAGGRIVKSGGKELALELEARGYEWLEDAVVPA